MLYFIRENGEEIAWGVGDKLPHDKIRTGVDGITGKIKYELRAYNDIKKVQASGKELKHILSCMKNIPYALHGITIWNNSWAQFIYDNITI